MAGERPIVRSIFDLPTHLISPDDSVRLAGLAGPPHGSSASVFLEIWEPGGSQPFNSHAESAEVFIVIRGEAIAHSDQEEVRLKTGDILVLQPGSQHRIVNTSPSNRLYTITVMADDGGFWDLVTRGTTVALEHQDLDVLVATSESA